MILHTHITYLSCLDIHFARVIEQIDAFHWLLYWFMVHVAVIRKKSHTHVLRGKQENKLALRFRNLFSRTTAYVLVPGFVKAF